MQIKINAEQLGTETVDLIVAALKVENITATPADIKTEVLNKDGKWIPFDPAKIRFSYSK